MCFRAYHWQRKLFPEHKYVICLYGLEGRRINLQQNSFYKYSNETFSANRQDKNKEL